MKKHFPETLCIELSELLKQANIILDAAKGQVEDEWASFRATKLSSNAARPYERLRTLRKELQELFMVVTSSRNWRCGCPSRHNIMLKLVPDAHMVNDSLTYRLTVPTWQAGPYRAVSESLQSHNVDCIPQIADTNQLNASAFQLQSASPHRRTAEYLSRTQLQSSGILIQNDTSGLPSGPALRDANVASDSVNAARTTNVHFEGLQRSSTVSYVYAQPSPLAWPPDRQSLCSFFKTQVKRQKAPSHYSVHVLQGRHFSIHNSTSGYSNVTFYTLSTTQCKIGYYNRNDGMIQHGVMSVRDRLTMAATLASSVFQIHDYWLPNDWSYRDIMVAYDAHKRSLLVSDMQVLARVSSAGLARHQASAPPAPSTLTSFEMPSDSVTNNEDVQTILRPLGEALCLILCGPSALDLVLEGLDGLQTVLTKLYDTWGRHPDSVANAVRECMMWSGPISHNGFDDKNFSSKVFTSIIWPLINTCQTFLGRTSSVLDDGGPGGQSYGNTTLNDSKVVLGKIYGNVYYNIAS